MRSEGSLPEPFADKSVDEDPDIRGDSCGFVANSRAVRGWNRGTILIRRFGLLARLAQEYHGADNVADHARGKNHDDENR